MQLAFAALDAHLARGLAPLYVIHGDEALFAIEAGDAIRSAARGAGCEREIVIVEQHFRWDAFLAANANRGLFGTRKLVDLRIPSGKPGVDGAAALEHYARTLDPDDVTLVTLPRIDRTTQASGWFAALADKGVTIHVPPLERAALPAWIGERLARNGQRAARDTLSFLAERCEGNLLAAQQEIAKLALVLPKGDLEHDAVERAVADVARYDIQELSQAWLAADARRALRIIDALRGEGEPVNLAVWQLGEDLHALGAVHEAIAQGQSPGMAVRAARVFGKRQAAMERAARRIAPARVAGLLHALAAIDAQAKGIGEGEPWDALATLALDVAGARTGLRPGA